MALLNLVYVYAVRRRSLGIKLNVLDNSELLVMEDLHVEVVQPPHLRPFVPVAPEEVLDGLERMPFPIACWYARELRRVIRCYKASWYWYYNQIHVLWLYLDSFDEVVSRYPLNPAPLPLSTYTSPEDERWVRSNFYETWSRIDCTAEAFVWHALRTHLPMWGLILSPAPIEGLHE